MLIDSHCHLDRLNVLGGNVEVDHVLNNARDRGVSGFLAIGVDLDSSQNLIHLAEKHNDINVAVGAHPLQEKPIAVPTIEEIVAVARHPKVVAIGETGLDYHYSAETKGWQQQSFIHHLQAAKQLQKPVVVHTRNACDDTLQLINEQGDTASGGVLHCFTETWDMAKAALDMNYYISFSGIITFRNAADLREVVKKIPLDRLLVETDSPWLAPIPYRGKPNVPAYVIEVAQKVAEIKGISESAVAAATTANFQRLFLTPR